MDAFEDWSEFLGRRVMASEPALAAVAVAGRSVLITGAGGSIGSGLARTVLAGRPRRLILLDVSEGALYECYRGLPGLGTEVVPVTGSVVDSRFLDYLFERHRPEIIFHAAAYKHVPLMERNPFSAVANNALGTYRLARAALDAGAGRVIAVSTDKAVNPLSIMGASKRIAELVLLAHSTEETRMNAVRLCNVLGSSGSVVEIFEEQAARRLPLTVTDVEAERYFVSPAEAEAAILRAAALTVSGRVLVPDCGTPFRITELAKYVAGRSGAEPEVRVEFTGLRPGDKLREELLACDEVVEAEVDGGMRVVVSPCPSVKDLAIFMESLAIAVETFDDAGLLAAVKELVPDYRRSALALGFLTAESAGNVGPSIAPLRGSAQDDKSLTESGAT